MCGHSSEEEEEEELSAYDDDEGRHNIWNDLLTYITDHAYGYRIQQSYTARPRDGVWSAQLPCSRKHTSYTSARRSSTQHERE